MPANDFLPIATAGGAPVLSQSDWTAATPANGRAAGILPKEWYNKAARQSSVMAAALGMFLNSKGQDALDDGSVSDLATAIEAALAPDPIDQQLASSGWRVFSGGLILQWVAGIVVSGPSSTPFTWPKAHTGSGPHSFPNGVFGAIPGTNGSFLSTGMVGVINLTQDGGALDSESGSDTPTCFVIGLGF